MTTTDTTTDMPADEADTSAETTVEETTEASVEEIPQDAPETPAVDDETAVEEEDTDDSDEPDPEEPGDPYVSKLRAESAKYRKRAQAAEKALTDALAQRDAANRQVLDNITGTTGLPLDDGGEPVRLRHPGDLFALGGVTPADLTNADGTLNMERLTETVTAMHEARPELFANTSGSRPMIPDPTLGAVIPPAPRANWSTVIAAH